MNAITQAAQDVLAERQRQVEAEGWTPEHDDHHREGELSEAAACYAHTASLSAYFAIQQQLPEEERSFNMDEVPAPHLWPAPNRRDETMDLMWPWGKEAWKPGERRQMLVKAGALILAEIERLDRKA